MTTVRALFCFRCWIHAPKFLTAFKSHWLQSMSNCRTKMTHMNCNLHPWNQKRGRNPKIFANICKLTRGSVDDAGPHHYCACADPFVFNKLFCINRRLNASFLNTAYRYEEEVHKFDGCLMLHQYSMFIIQLYVCQYEYYVNVEERERWEWYMMSCMKDNRRVGPSSHNISPLRL
jgi:hypothetical protein